MEENINELFASMSITVNGKDVPLNVMGVIVSPDNGNRYLVITDMEGLVGEDEFDVLELIAKEDKVVIREIEDEELYDELCVMVGAGINGGIEE